MDLSYQEKGLWLMFVGLTGAFGLYFAAVLPAHAADIRPQ